MYRLLRHKVFIFTIQLALGHIIYMYGDTQHEELATNIAIFYKKYSMGPIILYSDNSFFKEDDYCLGGLYGTWSIREDTLMLESDIQTAGNGNATVVVNYKKRRPSEYGFPTLEEDDDIIYPVENRYFDFYLSLKFIYKDGALYSKVPGTTDEYYQSYKQVYPDPKTTYYLRSHGDSIYSNDSVLKLGK